MAMSWENYIVAILIYIYIFGKSGNMSKHTVVNIHGKCRQISFCATGNAIVMLRARYYARDLYFYSQMLDDNKHPACISSV